MIYKAPSFSNRDFLDKLEETLHQIHLSKRKCLNYNEGITINTLTNSRIAQEYLNLIKSESFNLLTFEATHITETTQSCIHFVDHSHSNLASTCTSDSIATEIADQFACIHSFV